MHFLSNAKTVNCILASQVKARHGAHTRPFEISSSPYLSTTCFVTIQSYNGIK